MKKYTKKSYEELLNELGIPEDDKWSNGGRIRGNKYGSWLRRNDPIAFEVGYSDYKKENEYQDERELQK